MDDTRVLLVTGNRSVRRHVTRALSSAACNVVQAAPTPEEVGVLLSEPISLCIIDAEENEGVIRDIVGQVQAKYPGVASLLISHTFDNEFLLDVLEKQGLSNLVAKHGGFSANQQLVDESELIVTCQKLCRDDVFGIEKYLATWGIKVHEREIAHSSEKKTAIAELEEFLQRIDCHAAIIPAIALVADELLMNAIFDAPRDPTGHAKYAEMDRREPLQLGPEEHVDLRYACDGRYVAVAVSDRYGSLNREVIVRYLKRGLLSGKADIEEKAGGAGLGLYMVFSSITQLVFNICPGKRTEVIAFFYIRSGARAFKESGRSLNVFMSNKAPAA